MKVTVKVRKTTKKEKVKFLMTLLVVGLVIYFLNK
ncbi:MAG: hypothetical protein Q4F01_07355 [Staphylococcus rostri]|nr:hypothetical protein [Staphylococcus rostri]MDO5375988.1 hypothetical protein [Staphylococcus rostri]